MNKIMLAWSPRRWPRVHWGKCPQVSFHPCIEGTAVGSATQRDASCRRLQALHGAVHWDSRGSGGLRQFVATSQQAAIHIAHPLATHVRSAGCKTDRICSCRKQISPVDRLSGLRSQLWGCLRRCFCARRGWEPLWKLFNVLYMYELNQFAQLYIVERLGLQGFFRLSRVFTLLCKKYLEQWRWGPSLEWHV